MRASKHCVYCGVLMNKIENDPQGRTVEHMIPNVSVSIQRNNGEGDFHVCRKCNGDKSRTDKILGIMCRMVGEHAEGSFEAVNKFNNSLIRNESRFIRSAESVRDYLDSSSIIIPLTAKELHQYGTWLGKGSYFIKTGELLHDGVLVWVDIVSHDEVNYIKDRYKYERQYGGNAFDDLSKNPKVFNINGESFLIFSENYREIYICLNRVIMFHVKILNKSFINGKKCQKALRNLEKRVKG